MSNMKARVKATYYTSAFNEGEIVEIIPNMEADAADVFNVPAGKCFLCKKEDGTLKYIIATNLQLLSSEDDPDYWARLEHQAAIAAMQGMLNNSLLITGLLKVNKSHEDIVTEVTGTAIRYAHALVEKYKENEKAMH